MPQLANGFNMETLIIVGEAPGNVPASKSPTLNRVKKWVSRSYDWTNKSYNEIEKIRTYDKVIALGNVASTWLEKNQVSHLKIPHPSPRNRMWNDPQTEINTLQKITEYLS
jgi:uracil-DNA glycosylase